MTTLSLDVADLGVPASAVTTLSVEQARRLAAVLDSDAEIVAGTPLPLLWHWVFFTPDAPTSALGPDGHPHLDAAGPTATFPRRMWAGGRVGAHGLLTAGEETTRRSRVIRCEEKSGRSGDMLLVTVEHQFDQGGAVLVEEEQDLIYRSPGPPAATPEGDHVPDAPHGGWRETRTADPVLLFRFSAVTFNSHRIHYDAAYASSVEGYPRLVVHGPLTALLLAESARRHTGRELDHFEFRATAPLFEGIPFTVLGENHDDGVSLSAVRNDESTAMTATARLAEKG